VLLPILAARCGPRPALADDPPLHLLAGARIDLAQETMVDADPDARYLLLVGTKVHGCSLADCARKSGMTYEAVKKRRQRAMKAVGRFD
jgi:DNA-directed RNA polymerase specialized sigma24 family protein